MLASQVVKIVPAAATLTAPESVMAGSPFQVQWTGPAGQGDAIWVAKKGVAKVISGLYSYARKGNENATLNAPIEPGLHEVRYLGRGSKVLAAIDITVTPVVVTVRAPAKAMAGSSIEVNWTGPNGYGDYLVVAPKGSPERYNKSYNYAKNGNSLKVIVPETPGEAEVRYVAGRAKKVIRSEVIEIVAPNASVSGPAKVKAGSLFDVEWTGPGNPRDRVSIVPKGAAARLPGFYKQVGRLDGKPAKLRAPKKPGDYELRYVTHGGKILAMQAVEVTE